MAINLIEDKNRPSPLWLLFLFFMIFSLGIIISGTFQLLNSVKEKGVSFITYTTSDVTLENINISVRHPKYYQVNQNKVYSSYLKSYFDIEYKYKDVYDNTTYLSDSSYSTINCESITYYDDSLLIPAEFNFNYDDIGSIRLPKDNFLEISEEYTKKKLSSEYGGIAYSLSNLDTSSRFESIEFTQDGLPAVRTNIYDKSNDTLPSFLILHVFNDKVFIHCYEDFNYTTPTPLDVAIFDNISKSIRFRSDE